MTKLVILKVQGNPPNSLNIKLAIGEEKQPPSIEIQANLPPSPKLAEYYKIWQQSYYHLDTPTRIKAKAGQIVNISLSENKNNCQNSAKTIQQYFNNWLNSEPFRPAREKLLEKLSSTDEIRLILQTENNLLRRLPWHLWDFFKRYPKILPLLGTVAAKLFIL